MNNTIVVANIAICIILLIFNLLITIIYFSKENMNNLENKVYKLLLIGIVAESISGLARHVLEYNNLIYTNYYTFIIRIKLYCSLIFYFFIAAYKLTLILEKKEKLKKIFKGNRIYIPLSIYSLIFLILFLILPIKYKITDNLFDPIESPLPFVWGYALIFEFGVYFLLTILSIRRVEKKKLIPLMINDACFVVIPFTTHINSYNLAFLVRSVITFVMFHTLENPDIKLIRQLELAKNQAEQSNNAKSDFLASMSHELRTPLNAIVGLSQLIEDESTEEPVKNDAKDILVASENLLELVNGILDINKLEANELEKVEDNYNPYDIFNFLINMIEIRIGEKPIQFNTNISNTIPNTLYGDKDKLKRIISNLLTNAVKYTEQGQIDFTVGCTNTKDKCKLTITVKDTGRGISEERLPELFTKFNRLEEDKDSDIAGTGLGLAITKSLVELLAGKITVDSTVGEGSTFTVTLTQTIVENKEEPELL